MRAPLSGEQPEGFIEEKLREAGVSAWKLSEEDRAMFARELTAALDERRAYWLKIRDEGKEQR
jgi:hypothetical protein